MNRNPTWRSLAAADKSATGSRDKPLVFTVPPRHAFVDVLAAGIRADAGDDPLALVAVTVLLPTANPCCFPDCCP